MIGLESPDRTPVAAKQNVVKKFTAYSDGFSSLKSIVNQIIICKKIIIFSEAAIVRHNGTALNLVPLSTIESMLQCSTGLARNNCEQHCSFASNLGLLLKFWIFQKP